MISQAKRLSLVVRPRPFLLFAASLALASLGLIIWNALTAWQRPCRTAGLVSTGAPECPSLALDLAPLLVALGFWAAGLLIVRLADRPRLPDTFFLLIAGALAAGKLSAMGSYPGGRLFYLLLAWLVPLTFHFHYRLLARPSGQTGRTVLGLLYALAAGFSLPFLIWSIPALQQRAWYLPLRTGVRLSLVLAIGLVVLLMVRDYRGREAPAARNRMRLVTFGTLFAFAPLVLLSLLPDTLGVAHFPYELTFPWLLLSPLSYAYSLFRHRWAQADALLNRAAVYYLLIILLLGVYLAAAIALNDLAISSLDRWPLTGAGLGVALLLLFAPLKEAMRRLVNWIWYGGDISYARVVGRLAEALALALDRETLRSLLVDDLTALIRLSGSALLLKDGDGRLALVGAVGFGTDDLAPLSLAADGRLATCLEEVARPVSSAQVRRALAGDALLPEERAVLSLVGTAFWLPLVSGEALQGLLLLRPRPGGDLPAAERERILATLAYQTGVAAHNVRLMEQAQASQEELTRAHRQLLVGREQEQRRLAHELHDSAVQQLLGISYQLVHARRAVAGGGDAGVQAAGELASALEATRQEILGVVSGLRGLIGELRPAGLEELGLVAALEGHLAHLEREGGSRTPAIHLELDDSQGVRLPEPVAICLFRVTQEALRNVLKHAAARQVTVSLRLRPGEATLSVRDDGCGFRVPDRLSKLARNNHFGMTGMAERVAWAGGQMTVHSQPGAGTEVRAWIPYEE
jgi:signal transduction histidine kinase